MISTRIRLGACALAASALVAIPAAASAAPSAPTPGAVATDVRLSDSALQRAVVQAAADRIGRATTSFRASRAALARARKAAATLTRRARSDRDRLAAATAQRFVAMQQAENLSVFPRLVAAGDGALTLAVARATLADTKGRDAAARLIARLIEKGVPAKAAAPLSRSVASIQVAREAQTAGLQDLLAQVPVPPAALEQINKAIELAQQASRAAGSIIDRLIDQVPPIARPALEAARQALTLVEGLLPGLLGPGAPEGSAPPAVPVPDLSGLIPDLSGLIPDLSGLIPDLSALLPDLSALLPGLQLPFLTPR